MEPELLLQLPQSACERTILKLPWTAMDGAFADLAGLQGQRAGSTCYCLRGAARGRPPVAQGSPDHWPPFGSPQTNLGQ